MNLLDLAVTERNRLTRFCILLNAVSLISAIWARDPLLKISTPFTEGDVDNITVGHIILIGQPIIAMLFLFFVAQFYRYARIIDRLSLDERYLLDWRFRAIKNDDWLRRIVKCIAEWVRWFFVLSIPVISSGFLLYSQFDFKVFDDEKGKEINFSLSEMFNPAFSGNRGFRQSFRSLDIKNCVCVGINDAETFDRCEQTNETYAKIRKRLPKLYQPWNFIGGAIMQLIITYSLVIVSIDYFRRPKEIENPEPDKCS